MTRIAAVGRDALAPEGQAIWDRIASGRNGRVGGPYTALLHVPALADRVAALGDYFGGEAALPTTNRLPSAGPSPSRWLMPSASMRVLRGLRPGVRDRGQ
jgi:hypothetical protein